MISARHEIMDKTAEDLKDRTKRFAIATLEFAETLPHTRGCDSLVRQLARAGVSVAGNYRSACRARSHVDFPARLGVVLEEVDESELWLDVCEAKGWGDAVTARNNDRSNQPPPRRR